jgi:ATP-dependent phosphoenolpyruvate carboxykinase
MKPDWKNAPEWANWLAMDRNGEWYWYESKPVALGVYWLSMHSTEKLRYISSSVISVDWKETLEPRLIEKIEVNIKIIANLVIQPKLENGNVKITMINYNMKNTKIKN